MINLGPPEQLRHPLGRLRDRIFVLTDRLIACARTSRKRSWVAVLMPHGLGDLIIFGAAYQHIRAFYEGRPMLLVCTSANAPYAAAYFKPERILELDRHKFRRSPWYRAKTIAAIARAEISVVLQPAQNREHMIEDAIVRACGASERIGDPGSPLFITNAERRVGDPWYTQLGRAPGLIHDSEFYAAFALRVTGSEPSRRMLPLRRPARNTDLPDQNYLVIAGEASSASKAWPMEHFLAAAAAIAAQARLMIVITGRNRPNFVVPSQTILDMRGLTNLEETAAVLAHAELILCNDSGPAHLAAALGVPTLAIGNGAMPGRYLPYPENQPEILAPVVVLTNPPLSCFGCGWRCQYTPQPSTPVPCIAGVTVEVVIKEGLSILENLSLEAPVSS